MNDMQRAWSALVDYQQAKENFEKITGDLSIRLQVAGFTEEEAWFIIENSKKIIALMSKDE